jgi:ribonuclease-3
MKTSPQNVSITRQKALNELSQQLNIPVKDFSLLNQALTHSSYALENSYVSDNERIEFFGDAVFKFVVSEYLFKNFPSLDEGELTQIRSVLVSAKFLEKVANIMHLNKYILVGNGIPMKPSILARAMEAILGAIYLDSGFEHVSRFIETNFCVHAQELSLDEIKDNYKAKLQELTQAKAQGVPCYKVLSTEGPAHAPYFEVSVSIGSKTIAKGSGQSKKKAEQAAAKEALHKLTNR